MEATIARTRTLVDDTAARRALRAQIAGLERRLADAVVDGFADGADIAVPAPAPVPRTPLPRLVGLAELERTRDRLVAELGAAGRARAERAARRERARVRLEAMLRDPARHRFERISAAELGERGCGVYQVRPRLGLIGMLAGWWHVVLSSGCP